MSSWQPRLAFAVRDSPPDDVTTCRAPSADTAAVFGTRPREAPSLNFRRVEAGLAVGLLTV